jgi:hypothetical protein
MTFNFLGTLSTGQYVDFSAFLTLQNRDIANRIAYLRGEISRTGVLSTTWDTDTGIVKGIGATPANSVLNKLLSAYPMLGGYPTHELTIHSFNDTVYMPMGSNKALNKQFSNHRVARNSYRDDAVTAELMFALKRNFLAQIRFKHEDLEYKIKKLVDWCDQCVYELFILENLGNITQDNVVLQSLTPTEQTLFSRYTQYFPTRPNDARQRTIYLMPLLDVLASVDKEIRSGDHQSVNIDDTDYLGLMAGAIRRAVAADVDVSEADDIPSTGR